MSNQFNELDWTKEQLWKGCMLAALAHAIMVAHYPELAHEHSWDGINYNVQDGEGARGTVTFGPNQFVAAFRNEDSSRIEDRQDGYTALDYFNGAPTEVVDLAKRETIHYLLEDEDGTVIPVITTGFWGTDSKSYSLDSEDDVLEEGGFLLETQLMEFDDAVEAWQDYYEMSKKQVGLLTSLYRAKIANPSATITLSKKEIAIIGAEDQEGIDASKESFQELGILWEE